MPMPMPTPISEVTSHCLRNPLKLSMYPNSSKFRKIFSFSHLLDASLFESNLLFLEQIVRSEERKYILTVSAQLLTESVVTDGQSCKSVCILAYWLFNAPNFWSKCQGNSQTQDCTKASTIVYCDKWILN